MIGMKSQFTSHTTAAGPGRANDDACLVRELRDGGLVAAVADGIGSARAGGEAARRAVEMLADYFAARPAAWTPRRALDEFVQRINRQLHQESIVRFQSAELATTLGAVVVTGGRLYGANLGDSPVYLWRDGRLERLSEPHVSDAPGQGHVLTRAVGLEATAVPHGFELPLQPGDRLVLCSDGVSGPLGPEGIAALCARRAVARTFVAAAREQPGDEGGADDATVVVVEVGAVGDPAPPRQRLEVTPAPRAGDVHPDGRLVRAFDEAQRVWLAMGSGTQVVLKFPPLEAAEDEARAEGFLEEAWLAARLQAPEFVRARVPTTPSLRYYVQEHVDAPTLRTVLGRGPLPVEGVLALGRFLTRAAQALARHDLAHGDLKPENILVLRLDGAWDFRLIDLGSAASLFSVTSRAGTASYLAPERFRNAPLCERTEVFTIGAILHEALCGRLPFGEIERFQTPRFSPEPKPLVKSNPAIPAWLDSLVRRATTADPRNRYQHYSEIAHALDHPESVEPFHPAGAPWIERDPLRFYKVLSLVLFLGNLALLGWLLARS